MASRPPTRKSAAEATTATSAAAGRSSTTPAPSSLAPINVSGGDALLALAALFAAVALLQTFRIVWLKGEPSRRARRRVARARQGEIEGESLMRELGYHIVAVQPEYTWQLRVDGRPARVLLRPDLVVERDGRRYIADVKTGNSAPDPLSSATRRQLLEYLIACRVDGVLVVDVESRRVRSLGFPLLSRPAPTSNWPSLLLGLAAGAAIALAAQWLR